MPLSRTHEIYNPSGNNTLSGNLYLIGAGTINQHVVNPTAARSSLTGNISSAFGTSDPLETWSSLALEMECFLDSLAEGDGQVPIVKGGTGSWALTNSG